MSCFIIMPFDPLLDGVLASLKAAAEGVGYKPVRGDDILGSANILTDIWDSIRGAEAIVAILTGNNSNVFYELGLAHARGKPVVLVADQIQLTDQAPKGQKLPFDLWGVRVVPYDKNDPAWGERLKNDVIKTLEAVKQDPAKAIPDPFRVKKIVSKTKV